MQAVIPHLLLHGHTVRGVDNHFRYGRQDQPRTYEFIEGDLGDPEVADQAARGVDAIIQAAARIFGVRGFHKYPADIISSDLELHFNVLRAALKHDVRRVAYISSSMVYERCMRVPSREEDIDSSPPPNTAYGMSKLAGERTSRAFAEQYGIEYVIWRPFNVITPRERADAEQGISHVFADFLQAIVVQRANPLPILGDGEQVRCFTWIDDVASAIAQHSFSPQTRDQVFNLGGTEPIRMKDLALRIFVLAQDLGLRPLNEQLGFEHLPVPDDDVRIRIPSIEKAKSVLGWRPLFDLNRALEVCVRHWAEAVAPEARVA
jgi:UDP-glucose 4-epimerase